MLKKTFTGSYRILVAIMTIVLIATGTTVYVNEKRNEVTTHAANPAFGISLPSEMIVNEDASFTVTLNGSGDTFYGAEGHLTYDSSKITVTDVSFGTCIFDSCVDLSEEGTVKLLAASGPTGMTVSSQQNLATVSVTPIASGNLSLSFSRSDVINASQEVVAGGYDPESITIADETGAVCGDGVVEGTEVCDEDGDTTDAGTCNADCSALTFCGDNTVQDPNGAAESETCDDGNNDDGDGCSAICAFEPDVCGNGVLEGVEQCDDGNTLDSDGCSSICELEQPAVCGNSSLEAGEQCDDGNTTNGDGCSSICETEAGAEVCGNNIVEAAEQCDDGNTDNGDGCSSICENELPAAPEDPTLVDITFTVPGTVQTGNTAQLITFAEFSDGSSVNVTSPNTNPGLSYSSNNVGVANLSCSVCSTVLGNTVGSATITASYTVDDVTVVKNGSITVTAPPAPVCGDNNVDAGEQCDDGNTTNGDGCSSICEIEAPEEPAEEPEEEPEAPEVGDPDEEDPVLPAAPEDPEVADAVEEVEQVLEEEETQQEPALEIEAPTLEEIDQCSAEFEETNDEDNDGLSDRMECYLGTDHENQDTDGDTCNDGDEVNQLSTNPLVEDCSVADPVTAMFESVAITDPQPGWILPNDQPSFRVIAPVNATSISLVAVPTEDSEATASVAIGPFTEMNETLVSGLDASDFQVTSEDYTETFADGDYTLVAVAKRTDGSSVTSTPILMTIDGSYSVDKPVPRTLSDVDLPEEGSNLEAWVQSAFAQPEVHAQPIVQAQYDPNNPVEINELRPFVSGDSEFGSQVFAVWNSLVLTSSVISDSVAGEFNIQAPRDLEADEPHRVNLYAIKDFNGNKVRSDSVNVYFRIKTVPFPTQNIFWLLLLLISALVAIKEARERLMNKGGNKVVTQKVAAAEALYAQDNIEGMQGDDSIVQTSELPDAEESAKLEAELMDGEVKSAEESSHVFEDMDDMDVEKHQ